MKMIKLKITAAIILLYALPVLAENQTTAQSRIDSFIKPPPYPHAVYSTPSTEEPSLISKFTSWIWPFGGESERRIETVPAETRISQAYAPQYLPPAQQHHQAQNGHVPCNSCNNEPWIPVINKQAHSTVVGFVPPGSFGSHGNGLPLPQYGAPPNQHGIPPQKQYGVPPSKQYGVPVPNQYGVPPQNQYGAPIPNQYGAPPPGQFPPSPLHYQHGAPKDQHAFATNLNVNFGPPPPPAYFLPPHPSKYKPYKNHQKFIQKYKPHSPAQHGPPIPLKPGLLPPPPPFNKYHVPLNLPIQNVEYIQPPLPNYHLVNKPNYNPGHFMFDQSILAGPGQNIQPNQFNYQPVGFVQNGQNSYDQGLKGEVSPHIQVIPSIRVADYVASVEHPITVFQSPIVDVLTSENTEPKVSESTDVIGKSHIVEDTHVAAATLHNGSYIAQHEDSTNLNSVEQTQTISVGIPHPTSIYDFNNQPLFEIIHPSLQPSIAEVPSPNSIFSTGSPEDWAHHQVAFEVPATILLPQTTQNTFYNESFYTQTHDWTPTYNSLSTSMIPPPFSEPVWIKQTTKKPKHLQIIIPYTSNSPTKLPQLPLYTQPPSPDESVWSLYDNKQEGSNKVTATVISPKPTTLVQNIRDLLANELIKPLPFDETRLQNNIDDWTQREYHRRGFTSGRLVPSKKIPQEYLTTSALNEATTISSHIFDHKAAGSSNKVSQVLDSVDEFRNFITNITEPVNTVTASTPTVPTKVPWEKLQVSISPLTQEKIYVVTPQPVRITPKEISERILLATAAPNIRSTINKFSMVFDPKEINKIIGKRNITNDQLHVIFSEWPHLINNLMTTTTTLKPKGSNHPLFRLMDLTSYTPPPNSTVETILGHSRVISSVTPTSSPTKTEAHEDIRNSDTANFV